LPNSKITVVSNSATQKQFIDHTASVRGFKNLEVLTRDLGKEENYHFSEDKFDRVMSIEMMEHLRNYEKFFSLISKAMKPDAKFFIHIFTHKTTPYFFETEGEDNWMGKYFFSGGQMPARDLFDHFNTHLKVEKKWDWNGTHYQKTLEAWLVKMDQNEEKVRQLFAQAYGKANVEIWINRWRVFYMACAELFGFNEGSEWAVTHYLLTPKG
jgi:cyclopropane-fatty-acyl-phospholipid synthase